jgi:aspartate/glutamate racemase
VAEEAAQRGYKRVGITGTRWLVGSEVYPEKFGARGLDCLRPTDTERDESTASSWTSLCAASSRPRRSRISSR